MIFVMSLGITVHIRVGAEEVCGVIETLEEHLLRYVAVWSDSFHANRQPVVNSGK